MCPAHSKVTDNTIKVVQDLLSSSLNCFVELVFWYNILQLDRMSVITQIVDIELYKIWEK